MTALRLDFDAIKVCIVNAFLGLQKRRYIYANNFFVKVQLD